MNPVGHGSAKHSGMTRRGFLQGAAVGVGGLVASSSAQALGVQGPPTPAIAPSRNGQRLTLRNVRHMVVDYDKKNFCGHPRLGGVKSFGHGELAVLYCRAACAYKTSSDVSPSPIDGYLSRADVVLRRSLDSGQTWLPKDEAVLWSHALVAQKQAEFLCQDPGQRSPLDMRRPEAMFFFGRTSTRLSRRVTNTKLGYTCELTVAESGRTSPKTASAVFQIRSVDKGRTWERVPLVLDPPQRSAAFWKDNHPLVTMPDGALVGAVESDGALWLYGSECQGMTWQYLSRIAVGKPEASKPSSAGLVLLPSGRLQCYLLLSDGKLSELCLSESDDCFAWTVPKPIAGNVGSPWPLRLSAGRIVVVFARQSSPAGIFAIVSSDDGRKWSEPAVIRTAASGADIGHPVAVEMEAGKMFAAYQYQTRDGNGLNGTRLVSGSIFELV